MKKFLFLLVFIPLISFTQSLSKELISSSGGYFSNDSFKLNLSYGESVINSMVSENESLSLSNGFHFFSDESSLSNSIENLELSINLYPNPTLSYIYISNNSVIDLILSISDINGKIILTEPIKSDQEINLTEFASGVYFIKLSTIDKYSSKIFKVIKK